MQETEAVGNIADIDLSNIGKRWRPNRKQRRAFAKNAMKGQRNKLRRSYLAKTRAAMLSSVDGSEEEIGTCDQGADALASNSP